MDRYNFFASATTKRLWFLYQLEKDSFAYNMPSALRLTGILDKDALKQSLSEIVRRHEILRTTFSMRDGRPVQAIHSASANAAANFAEIDLQYLEEAERSIKVRQLADKEAQCPFDLTKGPLMRIVLLCLDKETHVLLLTMHHIVTDGWSTGIMARELSTLYNDFSIGNTSSLPELPIQYADFAYWQHEWLQGEMLENQLDFWKQLLKGAPGVLELPSNRPRPAIQTFRGKTESVEIGSDVKQRLTALSRKSDVTLFMTLLSAFTTLLFRYTGQADIVVGTPIANRNRAEIEGLIGFFANTLALRVMFSDNLNFRKLLDRVGKMMRSAYEHLYYR